MMINRLAVSVTIPNPITGENETQRAPMGLDTSDASLTLYLTVYAFFFIAIIQLIGILGGDRSPLQVNNFIINICDNFFTIF